MADKTREPDIEDAPEIEQATPITRGYDQQTGAFHP